MLSASDFYYFFSKSEDLEQGHQKIRTYLKKKDTKTNTINKTRHPGVNVLLPALINSQRSDGAPMCNTRAMA